MPESETPREQLSPSSQLLPSFGAVQPHSKPENDATIRGAFEKRVEEEVVSENQEEYLKNDYNITSCAYTEKGAVWQSRQDQPTHFAGWQAHGVYCTRE